MIFDEVKLKDIATILNGRAYKQNELLEDGKYKVLRVGNFFTSDRWYFSDLELDENKYCNFGDLLYAWSANFGPKIWNEGKTIFHYHIWKIELKENIDKSYIFYYLKFITDRLKNSTHGSVMMHLTKVDMENQIIRLPSYNIQKKIGKILSNIDSKMELNNQINDNLSEIIERMFINFLEKHNEELVTLEDAVKKIGTGADAIQRAPIVEYDTGIRCIRVGDMTNSRNRYEWGFTEMTEKDFDNYKLDIGDIVVTRTAVNGLSYMIEDDMKVVCNNGLIRMKVNEKYNPMFIYLYLKTKDFNEYVHRIDGETSVRPNMKVNYFTSYKIMKISKEEQDEICNRLLPLRNKQKQIIEENNTLTQLRDTLLPKLMNGEIDLDKIEI